MCPVAYEDPSNVWNLIEKDLTAKFPLRDVTWKSSISSSQITIDKLPLRCMPSTATLFKDTDHPFRWFLAPYVYIYILVSENMDSYKSVKSKLRAWVESLSGLRRTAWLVVYLPMGSHPIEAYQKIYSKLSSDFYNEKAGDRSSVLYLPGFFNRGASVGLPPSSPSIGLAPQNSFVELTNKLRDSVVASFQLR